MTEETTLARRPLGSAGPDITQVGFGAWAVGGAWKRGWGATDDGESVAAIRRAIEGGVNWVDTAAVYGLGHSEEVVGRALEPFTPGEDVLVFTKCGRVPEGPGSEEITNSLEPASIRAECEASLRRLGIERIDLYQFHWPDSITGTPLEDSWATMAELVDEGKVRWAGVSNFTPDLLERCEAIRHVDSLQPQLSLLVRGARDELLPWCREHGTGVIVYSPMGSGLLTGAFSHERVANLAEDDWRREDPRFQEPSIGRTLALVERLEAVAERAGVTLPVLAVGWAVAQEGVTAAIVGARRPDQVDDWLGAGSVELAPDVLEEIERAVADTGAGEA